MKKLTFSALAIGLATLARANSITVNAPNALVGELAYSMGVRLSTPEDQQITSMTISFSHVQLTSAPKGYLYVDLLDLNSARNGYYWDGDKSGDFFKPLLDDGQGISLGTQTFDRRNQTLDWSYTLSGDQLAVLNSYSADGVFNLGLDPDCFFRFNGSCNIQYDTCSKSVPDSGVTVAMLGVSFMFLAGFRSKLSRQYQWLQK